VQNVTDFLKENGFYLLRKWKNCFKNRPKIIHSNLPQKTADFHDLNMMLNSAHTSNSELANTVSGTAKGKAFPVQACTGPEGSKRLRRPEFLTIGT
jgi:hypothetical protein